MNLKTNGFKIRAANRTHDGLTKDSESTWNGSFRFIQAADCQFGLIDRYVYRKDWNDGITWTKEIHYLKLVIQSINKLEPRPRFLSICGDLVDAFPVAQAKLREEQIADLKKTLEELDPSIQLVCVCGNHDVGDEPTKETIDLYKKEFGDDYLSFWCNGCKFITLNSQLYFNSTKVPELKEAQEKWLDKELLNEVDKPWTHLMIFQHIPLFVKSHDEPAHEYFNIEPIQRKNLLERFEKAGVSKVFCGHFHHNAGGWYKSLECVVTTAIGTQIDHGDGFSKHGYRIVDVEKDSIKHTFVSVTEEMN